MDLASVYYLGVTLLLCAIFAVIVARIYHPKHRERGERPKYRMMEEEPERGAKVPSAERKSKEDRHAR